MIFFVGEPIPLTKLHRALGCVMCVCVCVCVCVFVCVFVCVCVCVYKYLHTYIHTYVFTFYIHTQIHIHMYICTHTQSHTITHTHTPRTHNITHTNTHTHMCVLEGVFCEACAKSPTNSPTKLPKVFFLKTGDFVASCTSAILRRAHLKVNTADQLLCC